MKHNWKRSVCLFQHQRTKVQILVGEKNFLVHFWVLISLLSFVRMYVTFRYSVARHTIDRNYQSFLADWHTFFFIYSCAQYLFQHKLHLTCPHYLASIQNNTFLILDAGTHALHRMCPKTASLGGPPDVQDPYKKSIFVWYPTQEPMLSIACAQDFIVA